MTARILTIAAAALLLTSPNLWAQSQPADPPGRVGRLSAIEGAVQQRTPDDNDWVAANLNYPVTTGFAIAPQDGGRAEIQVGSTALRVGALSELDVTNLTDAETSLTLAQGELSVRVGEIPRGQRIEVVTPRGVMEILAAGQYHLDAGTTENPTRFEVFNGRARLQRDSGNTELANGQAALINTDQSVSMAQVQPDPLDQWASARDPGPSPRTSTASAPPPPPQSAAAPYVSPEMTGAADLSAYGNWSPNPDYGEVWYPSGVPAGWAPYTYGHWAWVGPWGWTWIDDEPWGFAPFHYGRWAYFDNRWGWAPGEFAPEPVFAPALVVFVGGADHRFFWDHDHEGVGWFPLGPREAYVPGFRASDRYIRDVNRTSVDMRNFNITHVNNTVVINNRRADTVNNFANHRFTTVVPADRFGQHQRVRDVAVRNASVTAAAASLPVSHTPSVTPPHGAATVNRAAQVNRGGRPPLPQARTATGGQPGQPGAAHGPNTQSRTVAGHTLPSLPAANGNAGTRGPSAPGRFGASVRTPAANTNHALPPVPSAQGGSHAPQGSAVNNAAPNARTARGPFGTPRANTVTPNATAPNATSSAAGRGLSRPPAPQSHVAQPATTPTGSAGHRGFTAPTTPSFQRNAAAPTRNVTPPTPSVRRNAVAPSHNFTPPPRPQAPVHTPAPAARSFTPPPRPAPHVAAPAHVAPPAAPSRPVGNAAVSHAPAPHPQPHPANNNQKRNNTNN